MANTIKGLTVEIGGDTTQLGKALEDVNKKSRSLSSELGQVNRLLKMDPGNADILAQKQEILAEAVENTRKKLDTLKEAEAQVQAQFEKGEASAEQVRELQREIVAAENKLSQYENAAQETAEALDKLGDEADDAGDDVSDAARDLDRLGDAADEAADDLDETGAAWGSFVGNLASDALQGVIDFLGEAVEASREYRTEMGKLDTAFTQNGFTTEQATGAYKELVGVLGETDQSVEAANHLAKLTDNEKDLATWTGDILPGVFATFGDSLPIEGLTEAANETAKVGQVTGPLADAINWATTESEAWSQALSGNDAALAAFNAATAEGATAEDAFNEALAACSTEQERAALITQTLSSLYGEASASYKTMNADVIAANQANDAWTASLAGVGAEVQPLLTEIKMMGATLVTEITPVISSLLNNLPAIGVALAGIAAATVAFKVAALAATAATQGMTLAQKAAAAAQAALNVVMNANPIGLVILAITALVTAFMVLWNNCEGFREFWINLWEKIKTTALNVANALKELPSKIYNAILGAVNRVRTWGTNLVNQAKTAASNFLTNVTTTLRSIPSNVASAISGAISAVVTWGSNMVSRAKTAMSNLITNVTTTLRTLPSKVLSIGRDLVTGLWNGITNKLQWLKDKISGFASSVLGSIKSFFGVNSPSKETAWIGDMLDQGLAEGLLDNMKDPVKAMQKVTTGVLGAAGEVDGLTLTRQLQASTAATTASQMADSGILGKLDSILSAIQAGQILTIDGEALVGGTYERYDTKLGQRRALAARGALA